MGLPVWQKREKPCGLKDQISPVWKKLWKLNIPAKIKNFGWRVLHGLVPCLGVCNIISSRFNQVKFQHCHREANSVAHEIARNSFQLNLSCIWDDDPPSFVLPFLINDVSVFENQ
jgi:hypothetical protein